MKPFLAIYLGPPLRALATERLSTAIRPVILSNQHGHLRFPGEMPFRKAPHLTRQSAPVPQMVIEINDRCHIDIVLVGGKTQRKWLISRQLCLSVGIDKRNTTQYSLTFKVDP